MNISNRTNRSLIWIRGAGDLATGVAIRLLESGYPVILAEIKEPSVIRSTVAFAACVYMGTCQVEGHSAVKCTTLEEVKRVLNEEKVPVYIGDETKGVEAFKPAVFVEATIRKYAVEVPRKLVSYSIGLGPGFTAPDDVDAIIETQRGHDLGRVIRNGSAIPNTGIPGLIGGYGAERVIHSPANGIFKAMFKIGDMVQEGDVIGWIDHKEIVTASISGILRGVIHDGYNVHQGMKIADIDPRCEAIHCHTVSDKARAIGGGVLEAVCRFEALKLDYTRE